MKNISKIAVILFIFVFILPLFSCKNNTYKIQETQNKIAELTIYTYDGKSESRYGIKNLGHSFLSIKNTSENTIVVGNYSLDINETICVATWSILEHFGIWYNVESNYIKEFNKYDGRLSITKGIDANDLTKICEYISSHDVWNPVYNCSAFAINLWNSVAKESEKLQTYLIYKPAKLANNIKKFENYEKNKEIITKNNFGYFKDSYVAFSLTKEAIYV